MQEIPFQVCYVGANWRLAPIVFKHHVMIKLQTTETDMVYEVISKPISNATITDLH